MESMNQWQTNQTITDEAKAQKTKEGSVNQIVSNCTYCGIDDCTYCGIDGHTVQHCRKKKSNAAWHAKNNGKGGGKGGKKGGGRGGGNYRSFAGRGGDGKGKGSKGGKSGKGGKGEEKKTTTWQAEGETDEKADDKDSRKRGWIENKNYSGCYKCGDYYHKAADCTTSEARVKKYQKWEQHMMRNGETVA